MKKLMTVMMLVLIFLACDYAKESLKLKPDIEVTYLNPVAWSTFTGDSLLNATIDEIHFVSENSLDSYLTEFYLEYYRMDDTLPFFGPTSPVAIYGKIPGIVNPAVVDTFILLGVPVPLLPVISNLEPNETARVLLHFVAVDEYFEKSDTATIWFGIWKMY
jgi:hypothetical protein